MTSGKLFAANYDVYLLAGQSNMDGRGDTNQLTGGFTVWAQPRTNILIYYKNHYVTGYTPSWQTLKPGFSEDSGLLTNTFGPELSIGYVLANSAPGRNIALIKVSRGGTSLNVEWNPSIPVGATGGVMYQDLTNGVPAALQALTASGHTYTVRGMLWHQGEADISLSSDTYQTLLTNFIFCVRRDLNLPNLPFVVGEINRDNPNPGYATVRQAQFAASQMVSNGYFVTSMNLPSDGLHFYTTAVIGLGQRFGSQAAAFLPGPASTQTWDLAGSAAWSTNSVRWTTDGGATHHGWTNGNNAAVFAPTGGGVVTVSNGTSAYGVTISTNATGYSFVGGTLTNGNGGISAAESTSIGAALNLGGLQSWCVATGKTVAVSGPLNVSIHSLIVTGDGPITISGGMTDVATDPTNSAFLYDSSLVLKIGNGVLTVLNSNNFTGAIQIRGGSLQLGDGSLSNGFVPANIENNATLTFANPFSLTHTNPIIGTGTVVKAGAGVLMLTGSNTFSGGTIINSGTISISADRHLGNFGTLTLDNGAALQVADTNDSVFERAIALRSGGGGFDVNATGNLVTVSAPMSGTGAFTKIGAGALTIINTPGYTGTTFVSQGTLNLAASPLSGSLQLSASSSVVLGPASGLMGEYYLISPLNVSNTNPNFASLAAFTNHLAGYTPSLWSMSSAAGTNFDFGFSGSGPTRFPNPLVVNADNFETRWTGKFNAPSAGTYTFSTTSDDGSMLWIDGNMVVSNNAFQGFTTRSGTLTLSAGLHDIIIGYYQGNNTYGLYAEVTLPGGGSSQRLPTSWLQFGTTSFAVGPLSGAAGSSLNLSNYPLAINQTTDGTFAGNISGAGTITKNGAAELVLSGSNTFSGSTTANGGTLTLDYRTDTNNKISTDTPLLLNGATLKILGNASVVSTQRVSGLIFMSNTGASTVINQSGNTVLDFTSGNLSVGGGVSVNFLTTGGAGVRLPGTTNTFFGPWAMTDTGDPAFLNSNNFVVPFTSYDATLPASGADSAKNYLNTVGVVTNSETANLLNFRDTPSLSISNGAILHMNFGLLFPGSTALSINGGGQLGASNAALTINTSATLGTNALTVGALLSGGNGSVTKLGPGTLVLTNNSTYSGGTMIAAGIVQVGNGGNRGALGPGSITDDGTLVFNRGDAVAITNSISGNGALVQAGSNVLSITTPQSYTGGTIVNNGILLLATPDQNRALAFGSVVTVNAGGSLYVTNVNNVQNDESWTINGGIVKIVGGGHQHFGPITLNGGTMTTGPGSYAYDGTAGNYALDGNVVVTGNAPSTLDANTGINLGALVADGVAVTFTVADVTGDSNPDLIVTTKLRDKDGGGVRGLVKTGVGTMLVSTASDFTGTATISNGVLLLGHALAVQNGTVSNFVNGGLAFTATNIFNIGALAGSGDIALSNASGAVVMNVGNNNSSTRFDGALRGSGSVVKIGSGTLTLSAISTFTGATTISNGTLSLIGSGSMLNSSTISVITDATLDVTGRSGGSLSLASGQTLQGSGTMKGKVIVANGATLSPGNSVGTLTFSNDLVVSIGATLQYELGNNSDRTVVAGNLNLAGTLNISDAGGFTNGVYTLFSYGGALTYSGLTIGLRPPGNYAFTIMTNTPGVVNLSVTNGPPLDPFVQWQFQYFGCTNCTQAAPGTDADGTGQNNQFKYVAGLDPTNPASIFVLNIAAVTGQANQKNLLYNPIATGRIYTLQFNTDITLTNGWLSLTGYSGPVTNGSQVTTTDLSATQSNKFYRVQITLP